MPRQDDGFDGGKERAEAAEKRNQRAKNHKPQNRKKVVPNKGLIVRVECRNATHEER